MGKKPERREDHQPARRRRHADIQAGKNGFAAARFVEIKNRGDEAAAVAVIHHIHMRGKGVPPIGQITLEADFLGQRFSGQ